MIFFKYSRADRCPDFIKAPEDVSVEHFFLSIFTPHFQANLIFLPGSIWGRFQPELEGRKLLPSPPLWEQDLFTRSNPVPTPLLSQASRVALHLRSGAW